MRELSLGSGWSVLQDPNDVGEAVGVFDPRWDPTNMPPGLSEWIPIDRLVHLQVLFSENPYFGPELRRYNTAPWWYRVAFRVPQETSERFARIAFQSVDYFCRVWLNGHLLGDHEGYSSPFQLAAGEHVDRAGDNVLVARIWSPWDAQGSDPHTRAFTVPRGLMKGTYEHADTFVQRDVNPVGICGAVSVLFHDGILAEPGVGVEATVNGGALVRATIPLAADRASPKVTVRCTARESDSGLEVASAERAVPVQSPGTLEVPVELPIPHPRLWSTWDRGEPNTYRLAIELVENGKSIHATETGFGIRQVDLRRTKDETRFYLNGSPLFVRGATYFPEVYVSRLSRDRYYGDLLALKAAGCNAVRIHVHVEQPEFYELCDELGMAVIQDSDFNWLHPNDDAWLARALKVFGGMIRHLRSHPSIVAWICMNEPFSDVGERHHYTKGSQLNVRPGPQLEAEALRLDPSRPRIRGSGAFDDLNSGDSHN